MAIHPSETEPVSFRAWCARQTNVEPLTDRELNEIFTWSTKHGSGNGWTGSSGTGATYIRMLLRERQRLISHVRQ